MAVVILFIKHLLSRWFFWWLSYLRYPLEYSGYSGRDGISLELVPAVILVAHAANLCGE